MGYERKNCEKRHFLSAIFTLIILVFGIQIIMENACAHNGLINTTIIQNKLDNESNYENRVFNSSTLKNESISILPNSKTNLTLIWTNGWISPTASGNHNLYAHFLTRYTINGVPCIHLGLDMEGSPGDPVYALADGNVIESRTNVGGYGPGGTPGGALIALFTTSSGLQFKALYGHINNPHSKGAIRAGEILGYMNTYDPTHLHFAIHPGTSNPPDGNPWRGYATEAQYAQNGAYGYVDPIIFLNTYSPPSSISPPTVTNDGGASGISHTVATLGAQITDTGGSNPELHICWGTSNGGTNPSSWQHNANLGTKGKGTYYYDASPLTPGTTYYYRSYAKNSAGTGWASSTVAFTTTMLSNGVDKLGNYKGNGIWALDYNGNGKWDGTSIDRLYAFGSSTDQPVVGDWNGDGKDDLGNYKGNGIWAVDYNGNGKWDGTSIDRLYAFGSSTDRPAVGRW
jgi:murein DD-endopeptidase MepM/ murein hydrolase activator NlpD